MMIEDTDWTTHRMVVVDVEGNGAQPPEIVEIAILRLEGGRICGSPAEWLVRPTKKISRIVTQLHGISNAMVEHCPPFSSVAPTIAATLGNDYLVAHNARVELDILRPLLPNWKPSGVIDTLRLARRMLPGRKSYSLKSLTSDLGLAEPSAEGTNRPHRAAYDVVATARLLCRLAFEESGAPRPLSTLLDDPPRPSADDPSNAQGRLF